MRLPRMSLTRVLLLATASLALPALAVAAGLGPPGGTIYAHDVAYRTVGTPTNLPDQGPFNPIYTFDGFDSVTNAAPGDANFYGGRWEVHAVTFVSITPKQFTNAEDLMAAANSGQVSIGPVVKRFECPLIRKRER